MGNLVSQNDTQSSIILKLYKMSQQQLNIITTKIDVLSNEEKILIECKELEEKWGSCKDINSFWSKIKLANINKFIIDEILSKSFELSKSTQEFIKLFPDYFNEDGTLNHSKLLETAKVTGNYHSIKENLKNSDITFS